MKGKSMNGTGKIIIGAIAALLTVLGWVVTLHGKQADSAERIRANEVSIGWVKEITEKNEERYEQLDSKLDVITGILERGGRE